MTITPVDTRADRYGNAFLLSDAPDHRLPESGMSATDALRLLEEELVLDGIPLRNLATFVTTWMEPEAQQLIAENLHRNYIDHAEYPQTAVIEQRCVHMLADLFHAPGAARGRGTGDRPPEPRLRRRRPRGVGQVLPLLRRRAAHHRAAAGP